MEDAKIVALYWAREEAAIAESERKYGAYCYGIAQRVLANHEDTQETLDDTWLHAWNAMPPQKPPKLRPFFARLTRNLAINRWHRNTAEKRGAGMTLALEELPDLVSKGDEPQEEVERKELEETIRKLIELGEPEVFEAYREKWDAAAAIVVPMVWQVQRENGIEPYTPEQYEREPRATTEG